MVAIQVVRYRTAEGVRWGVHKDGRVASLAGDWETTGDFFKDGGPEAAAGARADNDDPNIGNLSLLAPITTDADIICAGLNYRSHLTDSGRDPDTVAHNIMFQKAASSICGPHDEIVRPSHVKALDYEVEFCLVVSADIAGPIAVSDENLGDYIGGIVMLNDVSARDVQMSHEQFYKAKSYRTFGPSGPFLVLLTAEEIRRWRELQLTLSVNGDVRQQSSAAEMVFEPAPTLQELSEIRDLRPGDIIATGTPGGTAIRSPGKLAAKLIMLMSPERRGALVAKRAENDPTYLRPGDIIQCSVATSDGAIDLGAQRNEIVQAGSLG